MLLYVFLSFIETATVISMIFSLYRWPHAEYRLEIASIAIWSAVSSYIMREVVGLPLFDPLLQVMLFIFFLRYVIKVRYLQSSVATLSVYVPYIFLQSFVITAYTTIGLITNEQTTQSSSFGAILVQGSSVAIVLLAAYLMHKFNLGFQFIKRPPHDFNVTERNIVVNLYLWISVGIGMIVVTASTALLLNMSPLFIIPLCLLSSLVLYYLSYRRELLDRDRIIIPKSINNNKTLGQ